MKTANRLIPGVLALALAAPATSLQAQPETAAGAQSSNLFNPAMSVIINGVYYSDNRHGEGAGLTLAADGFAGGHSHGHDHGQGHGSLERGFNLQEVEFAFSASVDAYFDAFVMAALTDGELELEEAFVTTRNLPAGVQAKFGKFLSDVGYINKQHPHSWHFVERPLVNALLFGDHGLQELGVQLSWLAPTDNYLRLGAEVLQGESNGIAQYLGEAETIAGTARILSEVSGPRLFTGFAKYAPDLGFDHAVQLGFSLGYSRSYQNSVEHSTRYEDHDGTAQFYGFDLVYKHTPGGRTYGQWLAQFEYFHRKRSIDRRDVYFACHPADLDCTDPGNEWQIGDVRNEQSFSEKQDGYYLDVLYGFAPRWYGGLRWEQVGLTNKSGRGSGESWDDSRRLSAALSFAPTEFSRLRLQLARADVAVDDHRDKLNQVFLQFQMSLGAHGAHEF